MGHTASAPEGREGRYQAGLKGRNLEVVARRAPRLLVKYITLYIVLQLDIITIFVAPQSRQRGYFLRL